MQLISNAYAAGEASAGYMQFLPFILIFVVFYFLLIRPQQRRAKEHKAMLEALQKGDEVVTAGGLLAKVKQVGENFVDIEVTNNVILKVQKPQIVQVMPKGTIKEA